MTGFLGRAFSAVSGPAGLFFFGAYAVACAGVLVAAFIGSDWAVSGFVVLAGLSLVGMAWCVPW